MFIFCMKCDRIECCYIWKITFMQIESVATLTMSNSNWIYEVQSQLLIQINTSYKLLFLLYLKLNYLLEGKHIIGKKVIYHVRLGEISQSWDNCLTVFGSKMFPKNDKLSCWKCVIVGNVPAETVEEDKTLLPLNTHNSETAAAGHLSLLQQF